MLFCLPQKRQNRGIRERCRCWAEKGELREGGGRLSLPNLPRSPGQPLHCPGAVAAQQRGKEGKFQPCRSQEGARLQSRGLHFPFTPSLEVKLQVSEVKLVTSVLQLWKRFWVIYCLKTKGKTNTILRINSILLTDFDLNCIDVMIPSANFVSWEAASKICSNYREPNFPF